MKRYDTSRGEISRFPRRETTQFSLLIIIKSHEIKFVVLLWVTRPIKLELGPYNKSLNGTICIGRIGFLHQFNLNSNRVNVTIFFVDPSPKYPTNTHKHQENVPFDLQSRFLPRSLPFNFSRV